MKKLASILVAAVVAIAIGVFFYSYPPASAVIDGTTYFLPPSYKLSSGRYHIPFIGESLEFLGSTFDWEWNRFTTFGNVSFNKIAGYNVILLAGSEGIKTYYNTSLVARAGGFPFNFELGMNGKILNMLDDDEYRERRKTVMHALAAPQAFDEIVPIMTRCIRSNMEQRWKNMTQFQAVQEFHRLMAQVSMLAYLQVEDIEIVEKVQNLVTDTLNGLQSPPLPFIPFSSFSKGAAASGELTAMYVQYMDQYASNPSLVRPNSMLSRLMEGYKNRNLDTRHGIAVEVHHMVVASQGLVGNALADMIMALSLHSAVYNKAKAEVEQIIGTKDTYTKEDLDKLHYVGLVTEEVRRLYPMVAAMMGVAKDDFVFQNYLIPKGVRIAAGFYATLHDPNEYSEPWKFKPERFMQGEPKSGQKQWAWVPQGAAHHKCAGFDLTNYMMRIVAVEFLRNNWQLLDKQSFEQKTYLFNPEPKDGVWIKMA